MTARVVERGWDSELARGFQLRSDKVLFVSPFIKARAIEPFLGQLGNSRIITRFSQQDFADRVSDIAALRLLLDAGAAVRGVRHLHAKLYVFGSRRAIITSANLTVAGLTRNHEFGLITDERGAVADCRRYFNELWARAGGDLSAAQLEQWEERVTQHLAFGGATPADREPLEDAGRDIGILRPPTQGNGTSIFDDPQQAFVKFLGQGNNRAPLSTETSDEVAISGCHWALAYPTKQRPKSVQDDAVMYIARLVQDGDIRVFGRALGLAYRQGRDDATEADVSARSWKSRWGRYIRVHHAEFVAGTLADGVSLRDLMDELRYRAFASTTRHFAQGAGNTDPRRSFRRKPAVELSAEGESWLRERLEAAFDSCGKIPHQQIDELDWPAARTPPLRARGDATTDDVKALVHEVLATMAERSPDDFDEHVTRRVCERIEAHPPWLNQYRSLCDERSKSIPSGDGKSVVNNSIGRWTKRALNAASLKQVPVARGRTSLIQSYTLLRFSPPTRRNDLALGP